MKRTKHLAISALLAIASVLSFSAPSMALGIPATPAASALEVNGSVIPASALIPYLSQIASKGSDFYPGGQFTSVATGNGTAAQGALTGANFVVYATSGATALTTRTAALMFTDTLNAQVGGSYVLRIYNTNGGTLTITAGSGVTLTGTATIATTIWREYLVTFNSATTLTMQNIGSGNAN